MLIFKSLAANNHLGAMLLLGFNHDELFYNYLLYLSSCFNLLSLSFLSDHCLFLISLWYDFSPG
jgi:hypothetical protein